uniref:Succinate dehydrogenase subunit 4 n=1 Tax=Andalucia godoyi TaxID=505711 RepID=M4QBP9_ANDGO|nr:succinate dehydrogenase subunit 4 [Andalucia godoyi]AGH24019.1 succinate dehydrogenase subunit 4 [Andalucia godoyi]
MLAFLRKKHAALHWYAQRFTAVALLPLFGWIIMSTTAYLSNAQDLFSVAQFAIQQNPFFFLILNVLLFWHIRQGLESIVVDYVHNEKTQFLVNFFIRVLTVLMIFSSYSIMLSFL